MFADYELQAHRLVERSTGHADVLGQIFSIC
jgi:hypothetical protein